MPYLSFDLDAKKRVAPAAKAAGVEPGVIAWGLLELWEHAWVSKTDVVGEMVLDGCFGPSPRVRDVLVAFGFIEAHSDGRWRVKGADRYLRVSAARSEGGKKASGNLKQNRKSTGSPPAPAGRQPVDSTGSSSGSAPALSPNTEHRAPNKESKATAGSNHEKQTNPRHAPMVKALVAACPGYAFQPRDAKAVTELLALGADAEILARWKRALAHKGFPTVRTLSELVTHWNHFAEPTRKPGEEPPCRLIG